MANEPVDIESLIRDADDSWLGLARGTTMGHIHLHVRDIDEAERFYCGVLGFDVMLRWPPSALFVSAGGYHHHIGLNTWAGVGAHPPPEDSAGLENFEIVLPNNEARKRVIDRISAAGVEIDEAADGALVRDPSKNQIRLVVD
jgi:catechol 2,3-dioxygenase